MSYSLDIQIGSGADGPVHRAVADRLGARPVAVRHLPLDGDGLVHLRRHAEALAAVGHPRLGLITDVARLDDDTVLVATTLGTQTLADRMAAAPLPVDEVLEVVNSVAAALHAAHRAALPHGAVHADNVVWAAEPAIGRPAGVPILVDLGLTAFRHGTWDQVDPAVWCEDRRALMVLARDLVEALGPPATTRQAALADLVARGDELVDDPAGLATLARECERIAHRPDRPLPVEQPVPVTSAPLRPPRQAERRRPRRGSHRRRRPDVGLDGRRVVTGAALAAGLALGVVATFAVDRSTDPDDATPAAHLPVGDCGPDVAVPTPPSGGEPVPGFVDLDADGCADSVWWSPSDATLHVLTDPAVGSVPDRFGLGAPGDQLVVGDWDCDGATTPAIYRPDTGETFHFDRWAAAGRPVEATPGDILPPRSVPHTDGDDDGCDRIVVTSSR